MTGSVRTSPDPASTMRRGPSGSGAIRSPSPGPMNASCGPDGANPRAAGPSTGTEWLPEPSLAATTTDPLPASFATTYASYRPSDDAAGARNTPGSPATVLTVVPSIPTAPRNALVSAPVWTSIRAGPSHAQYIGWPWRRTRGRAAPVRRDGPQRQVGSVRGEERHGPAVGRPVEVEGGVRRALVDDGGVGRRAPPSAPGREDVDAHAVRRRGDDGDVRPVRRPGREPERRVRPGRGPRGWRPGRRRWRGIRPGRRTRCGPAAWPAARSDRWRRGWPRRRRRRRGRQRGPRRRGAGGDPERPGRRAARAPPRTPAPRRSSCARRYGVAPRPDHVRPGRRPRPTRPRCRWPPRGRRRSAPARRR